MFFRPTTSCKWSVCGTVTGDSWMPHHGTSCLPTRCLRWTYLQLIGLRLASRFIRHCNLCLHGTHLPTVPASLRDPVHISKKANESTTQDILCKKLKLPTKNVAHVMLRKRQRFGGSLVFFPSPTAAAAAAARGPSARGVRGFVTTSGSHVVVTACSVRDKFFKNK